MLFRVSFPSSPYLHLWSLRHLVFRPDLVIAGNLISAPLSGSSIRQVVPVVRVGCSGVLFLLSILLGLLSPHCRRNPYADRHHRGRFILSERWVSYHLAKACHFSFFFPCFSPQTTSIFSWVKSLRILQAPYAAPLVRCQSPHYYEFLYFC